MERRLLLLMVRGRGHCGGSFLSLCVHESYNPTCLNTIAVLVVLFLCVCCPPLFPRHLFTSPVFMTLLLLLLLII